MRETSPENDRCEPDPGSQKGKCTLIDPERTDNYCLHFEDSMDSLRLKADALKGSLS